PVPLGKSGNPPRHYLPLLCAGSKLNRDRIRCITADWFVFVKNDIPMIDRGNFCSPFPSTGKGRDRGDSFLRLCTPTFVRPCRGRGNRTRKFATNSWLDCRFWFALVNVVILTSIALPDADAQQLDTLNVSYASVTGSRIPLWIAKDAGLFEKHSL